MIKGKTAKELIEKALDMTKLRCYIGETEDVLNQALVALDDEKKELEKEIFNLKTTITWSAAFDNITVKDLREFLQALKKGGET